MGHEDELINSPLEQTITEEGRSVEINIYRLPESRWTLEVVDQYGNSTVWDDDFESDREALDEALRTVREEGIGSLIGTPSPGKASARLEGALTPEEFEELDEFLCRTELEDTSMDVSTLDGFLTAIVIGPRLVKPSVWLPWIWDMDDAENAPNFEGGEQANRIMSLIMRHYNSLVHTFNNAPETFEAIFWEGRQWGAAEWCEGFLLGTQMDAEVWPLLFATQPKWFAPFMRLGTQEGRELNDKHGDTEQLMNEVGPSVLKMHSHWKQYEVTHEASGGKPGASPIMRNGPKVGRNDPCPCGSEKKFKKCCGLHGGTPTLH